MKRLFAVIWIALTLSLSACSSATADKEEAADKAEPTGKAAPSLSNKATAAAPIVKTVIPAGTELHVALKDGVSTSSSTTGSEFSASLAEPVILNGETVLDKGTPVTGRVVDVQKSGRVKGRASLSLALTSVVHNGKSMPVETRTYVGYAKSTKKHDAGLIGGAAAVGTAIGAIAGGGKGAATGAAVGGAGGSSQRD